jgi:hypothetical protein
MPITGAVATADGTAVTQTEADGTVAVIMVMVAVTVVAADMVMAVVTDITNKHYYIANRLPEKEAYFVSRVYL